MKLATHSWNFQMTSETQKSFQAATRLLSNQRSINQQSDLQPSPSKFAIITVLHPWCLEYEIFQVQRHICQSECEGGQVIQTPGGQVTCQKHNSCLEAKTGQRLSCSCHDAHPLRSWGADQAAGIAHPIERVHQSVSGDGAFHLRFLSFHIDAGQRNHLP